MKKHLALVLGVLLVFSLAACSKGAISSGGKFPSKQITVVCPYAAGGASDTISRLYAAAMQEKTGVSVLVENKTGAGGAVGFEAGASAEANGYTITYLSAEITTIKAMGNSAASPADFIFLGSVMKIVPVIAVPANSKWNTLKDYIDAAKAAPGQITCGTAGSGNFYHIGALQLMESAGIKLNMVPFNDGAASAIAALLGDNVDSVCVGTSEALSYVLSGQFKLLAVLSEERSTTFPDVPTATELGYPSSSYTWGAFAVPKGTSVDVVDTLRKATEIALNTDEMKATLKKRGFEHYYVPGDEYQTIAEQLCVKNSALIKQYSLAVN